MDTHRKGSFLPMKISYNLPIIFCMMSVIPLLSGIYIASVFISFPFVVNPFNLLTVTFVLLFSMGLSILGYRVTLEMTSPISRVAAMAHEIAEGKLMDSEEFHGVEEIEDLSRSLKAISSNARELLEKVEKLSQKDKLTGLHNVSYIRERLNEEIQRAVLHQQPCAFIYFVVDNFDAYAHVYGQPAADEILKSLAQVYGKHLSALDRAARIIKGEFAVIFPDRNKKKAIEVAERIREDIAQVFSLQKEKNEALRLSICVGISENPIDGISAQELFVKAQQRARASKLKGANLIEAFV